MTKEHGDQNGYNVDYYRCVWDGAEFFQYYFQDMVDFTSFGLRMSHKFLDTRYVTRQRGSLARSRWLDLRVLPSHVTRRCSHSPFPFIRVENEKRILRLWSGPRAETCR